MCEHPVADGELVNGVADREDPTSTFHAECRRGPETNVPAAVGQQPIPCSDFCRLDGDQDLIGSWKGVGQAVQAR